MANDGSPRERAGRRWCGTITRVDLLTFLLAAALCSASYCLGVWHNSRGAADSRVLGPSAAFALGAASSSSSCGGDADEPPLDFEARHAAEDAGLSVSTSSSATAAASANANVRRALRGAAPGGRTGHEHRGVLAWAARVSGSSSGLRFGNADAVRA